MTCSLYEVLQGTFSILRIWKDQTSIFEVYKKCPDKEERKATEGWAALIWSKGGKCSVFSLELFSSEDLQIL